MNPRLDIVMSVSPAARVWPVKLCMMRRTAQGKPDTPSTCAHAAAAFTLFANAFTRTCLAAGTICGISGFAHRSGASGWWRSALRGGDMSGKSLSLALILFTVATNAAAQIMLKKGMLSLGPLAAPGGIGGLVGTVFSIVFNPWVFAGLSMFVVSMASHLIVLSRVELSFAYPFLSLAYVIVAAYAFFIFGEDVGPARIAGIALIMAGTVFISMS
jgi:multidrug transporter EmrE-like cation transporter